MEMTVETAVLDILKKHNKAALAEIVDVVLAPALDAVVKQSGTPIDDVILAAIKEPLKVELKKLIEAI